MKNSWYKSCIQTEWWRASHMRRSYGILERILRFSRTFHVRTCPVNGELIFYRVQYEFTRIIYPKTPNFPWHGCRLSAAHVLSPSSLFVDTMKKSWILYNGHVFVGISLWPLLSGHKILNLRSSQVAFKQTYNKRISSY